MKLSELKIKEMKKLVKNTVIIKPLDFKKNSRCSKIIFNK